MSNEGIKRIITALLIAPPVFAIIYFGNSFHFRIFLSLINLICLFEFLNFYKGLNGAFLRMGTLLSGTLIHLSLSHYLPGYAMIFIVIFTSMIAINSIMKTACSERGFMLAEMGILFLGTLYISSFLGYYGVIRGLDGGREWIFFIMSIVFASDILAYYTGKVFGKRRFSPKLSPSKTWEGVFGGWAGGIGGGVVMNIIFYEFLGWKEAIVLSFIVSILGQIGDLFESMIKRYFGIKDSGRLLPGHGGLWDRIDSLIFVAPWVYGYIILLRPFIN